MSIAVGEPTFPGATSVTFLDVYTDKAPDGHCGGTPHLHTVSTEAYVVIAGRGLVQTVDSDGFHEIPLSAGSVVWFTPGTVHRAVNLERLRIVVLMSNAGLPETGDAVMTFPPNVLRDPALYRAAASLPPRGASGIARRVSERRDLAVEGFSSLRSAVESGNLAALADLHEAAGRIVAERAIAWQDLIRTGPIAQAARSLTSAKALADGDGTHLARARTMLASNPQGEAGYGMCGRLRRYDVDQA